MWAARRGLAVRTARPLPALRLSLHNGGRPVAAHLSASGARALAVPAGWDKQPAEVFPTTADVMMFVSSERYRWEAAAEGVDADADDARQLRAAKRMMLRHAFVRGQAVELGEGDGPGAAEIQRYLHVGSWLEAELYDSLRPGAEHLEMMSEMLELTPEVIKHVVGQLRHTSANPLGAAMNFPTEEQGGPSLEALLADLKSLSYSDFSLRYPGKSPEYIKSVWDLVQVHISLSFLSHVPHFSLTFLSFLCTFLSHLSRIFLISLSPFSHIPLISFLVQGKPADELTAFEIQSLETVGLVLEFLETCKITRHQSNL